MKKALVTGASGFIGSALVKALLEKEILVVAVDIANGIDITNAKDVRGLFEMYEPDTVFHLAAVTSTQAAETNVAACMEINVVGTANILSESKRCEAKRVVLANTYLPPCEPYSISKWCAWHLSDYYRTTGLNVGLLAHCNVYGPGDLNNTRLIPATILQVLHGRAPFIKYNTQRAFVFIDDVVRQYLDMAECGEAKRSFIGPYFSVLHVMETILKLMGSNLHPQHDTILEESARKVGCNPVQNGHELTPFEHGLKITIDWYRKRYA